MGLAHLVKEAKIPAGPRIPEIAAPFARLKAWVAGVREKALQRSVDLALFIGSQLGISLDKGIGEAQFQSLIRTANLIVQPTDRIICVAEGMHPAGADVSLGFQQPQDFLQRERRLTLRGFEQHAQERIAEEILEDLQVSIG